MPRESDLDRTTRTVKQLFHKVKQTASKHEFTGFELLASTAKLEIQLEDFAHIQRAIFNYARERDFDPIPFLIKDKNTDAILFRAELQAGRGMVVQDLKLPSQDRKLMIFMLPNNPMGTNPNSSAERTVGKLQVTTDETLHKIGKVLSPNSDQFTIHNMFKTSSDIQIRETNPWWFRLFGVCFQYYTKCYKFSKDGAIVAKILSSDTDSERILTVEFFNNPDVQTRATILGSALYFTLNALPELMRLLDSTLPESTTRTVDI